MDSTVLLTRGLLAMTCLLVVRPAAAYVDVTPPSLGALCNDSVNIYVLQVEKASAEKGVILFKCVAQLKGKPDPTASKHVIPAAIAVGGEKQTTATDVIGPKVILDWATEGKKATLFTVTRGDDNPGGAVKGVGHAYIDNYWYTLSYDQSGKCWVAFKSERSLLTRYCGPADKLGDAVAKILGGEEVVVPARGDKEVRDVRASLQLLGDEGNKKPQSQKPEPGDKKPEDQKPEPVVKKPGSTPAGDKKPADSQPTEKKPDKTPPTDNKPGDKKAVASNPDHVGTIQTLAADGKRFTLLPLTKKNQQPAAIDIQLGDGAAITSGKDPGQLAVGQIVSIWLRKGATPIAAKIQIAKPAEKPEKKTTSDQPSGKPKKKPAPDEPKTQKEFSK